MAIAKKLKISAYSLNNSEGSHVVAAGVTRLTISAIGDPVYIRLESGGTGYGIPENDQYCFKKPGHLVGETLVLYAAAAATASVIEEYIDENTSGL